MNTDKRKLLEQIRADILSENICPDLAKQATNLVMGVGSIDADVMFVGEAPGRDEDKQGEPFVGVAGRVLNQALVNNQLERADVYITNIVKYRPPNNRDPEPEEKRAFWPFLLQEIKTIGPKLIVPLGRHSMGYFLPEESISKAHGRVKNVEITKDKGQKQLIAVMPIYHPAATIYNRQLKADFEADFAKIKEIINQITKKEEK